jgi:nucleosome assembly protein 1-like 1
MAEPIKHKRLGDLANAPTPQNTPATAASSFAQRVANTGPSVATIKEEDGGLGNLANNPALISMIQGKLGSLVGKSSGYIESLPKAVRGRLSGLKGIQAQHTKLEIQFQEELLELEKKYFAKYEPLYERRAKIVSGDIEPSVEEIEAGKEIEENERDGELEQIEEEDEEEDKETTKKEEDEEEDEDEQDYKGVPEFWLTALKNMVILADAISERDEEALRHLTDIRMKYLEKPGFALVFEFSENAFFTNKTLTKTYYYQEDTVYGGEFIYDHAEGDEIQWTSPDNNLTVIIEKRKQRNKHTKATRTVEKSIPTDSFFAFFSPPKPPSEDDEEEGEEEYPEDIDQRLELDYQLGEEIKDKLIPRAIDWYTGEALAYEDLGDEDEDEFEDEDDSEDDDEDDDDEDDDDDEEDDQEGGAQGSKKEPSECNQS